MLLIRYKLQSENNDNILAPVHFDATYLIPGCNNAWMNNQRFLDLYEQSFG